MQDAFNSIFYRAYKKTTTAILNLLFYTLSTSYSSHLRRDKRGIFSRAGNATGQISLRCFASDNIARVSYLARQAE